MSTPHVSGACTQMFLILISFWSTFQVKGQTNVDTWLLEQKLPEWSLKAFRTFNAGNLYRLSDYINPFYLEADFNGDNRPDIAMVVEQTGTNKKGFVIIHHGSPSTTIIGAGKDFGNGGDNFDWMDIWRVYTPEKINPGVGEAKTVHLRTKAIYVAKSESSSAVIYWNGTRYTWHHQGD